MKKFNKLLAFLLAAAMLLSFAACKGGEVVPTEPSVEPTDATAAEAVEIQILATSDLHGKFVPYDYALNAESADGSVAQIATFDPARTPMEIRARAKRSTSSRNSE